MLVSGSYLTVFPQTNMHALEQELPNGYTLSSGHTYVVLIFINFPNDRSGAVEIHVFLSVKTYYFTFI